MGRLVPYRVPWRMGADEATSIHLPVAGSVAGVELQAGWYSLYAVPGEREWQIVVNREARRWGTPIDDAVHAADIGRGTVRAHATDASEDLLRMRFDRSAGNATELVVHWDRTDPACDLVQHLVQDAPGTYLAGTTLLGGLVGALLGRSDKAMVAGALIGAAIGGVALAADDEQQRSRRPNQRARGSGPGRRPTRPRR